MKSFPALSGGFEIETELTVHALELRMAVAEIDTPYFARTEGSFSKLSTFGDGFRIALTILKLVRDERSLSFFGLLGLMWAAVSLYLGVGLWITFIETGLVPKLPSAVLATGLMLSALLRIGCGIILDTVTTGRREMKRLHYLQLEPVERSNPSVGECASSTPACKSMDNMRPVLSHGSPSSRVFPPGSALSAML